MQSTYGSRGIAVAPHSLAAQSAVDVLREGGNALEAMIAAAATIAVVYPHMNAIGGDGFWVIRGPNGVPGGIDASGRSARAATQDWYAERGITSSIPFRGGTAALTVAGTVSGWGAAHRLSQQSLGGRMPLTRLLADGIHFAHSGMPTTFSQSALTSAKRADIEQAPGFVETFLPGGVVPQPGQWFKQPRLAATLERIAVKGTDEFYRGALARQMAAELQAVGSPLRLDDLRAHQAVLVDPLTLNAHGARLHNMVPPSQGVVSLMILGMMERMLKVQDWRRGAESAEFVHAQVEATKRAFKVRDAHVTDRAFMRLQAQDLLTPAFLDSLVADYNPQRALPWGRRTDPGDTIWMGVIDRKGLAVSFIQSLYHEFGSGVVLPDTGVNWQNRGCSFSLQPGHITTP
ncbi:MAG: gamma-glutamyltransferase family protein, partial [Betaproteobacteria bacterium]